jgi:hypothetical protein
MNGRVEKGYAGTSSPKGGGKGGKTKVSVKRVLREDLKSKNILGVMVHPVGNSSQL